MLIIDMPMPKCCWECPCCDGEYGICESAGRDLEDPNERPSWCPIKGEIVPCDECVHRDPEDKRCDCGGHEWVIGKILPVKDDFFCADGERKEGAE